MKLIPGQTDSIIVIFGRRVLKLPLTFGALRELYLERQGSRAAKTDPFFSRFVLSERLVGFARVSDFLPALQKNPEHDAMLASYFQEAFSQRSRWPRAPLGQCRGGKSFLDFIVEHFSASVELWRDHLSRASIARSSCHGDFHEENIFTSNEQLKFTDWPLYDAHASRYFDLINYFVFAGKGSLSWIQFWQQAVSSPPEKIFEISVPKEYWLSYALWKIGAEIAILKIRGRFNAEKIKKYSLFVTALAEKVQTQV